MKFIHRVTLVATPKIQADLALYGIRIPDSGPWAFEIDESNQYWPDVRSWMVENDAGDFTRTEFTKDEIAKAKWLDLRPEWHYGYPQPDEDNFGYQEATYDLTDYCEKCGIGLKQKAPFQIKGEPKWGRRSIFQLNWVFDEYFVTPQLWESVFKPHGVDCRPVLNRKRVELQTVVQLVVPDVVPLATDWLLPERCKFCGRIKYRPHVRGYFPALQKGPSCHIVKSQEYFGSGAGTFKAVLVSQSIVAALISRKSRGAVFTPTAT